MDYGKSDKDKKEQGGGMLFGKTGPVSLGAPGQTTHLGQSKSTMSPYTEAKPYETSIPELSSETTPYKAPSMEPKSYEAPQAGPVPPFYPPAMEVPTGSMRDIPDSNASVSWSPTPWKPRIERNAFIHPHAMVSGNVRVMSNVFVCAGAVIRGENDEPIYIGEESNIQECVVLKDLPSRKDGSVITQRIVDVGNEKYSLYIGNRVSIAAQAQVHGPAYIGNGVYLGMQSLVFWARVEQGVILEPGSLVMNVTIPSGRFVPAGLKVTTQKVVSDLPPLTSKYRFYGINEETVDACLEMLRGYRSLFRLT